jgi:tRNA (guanine-N7-)-methyltransferase
MARQKLKRFNDSLDKPNILVPEKPNFGKLKGKWARDFFGNSNPLVLELGCGKGEYSVGMAAHKPNNNFIGVDLKGQRIWVGADAAIEQKLPNVAFLRAEVQNIDMHFAPAEVSQIWIPFPDPRPRGRDERRRLTSPRFLALYKSLLKEEGTVHLKTDNIPLYTYTLEVLANLHIPCLAATPDLYNSPLLSEHYGIVTYFERKYVDKGLPIAYLRFAFP